MANYLIAALILVIITSYYNNNVNALQCSAIAQPQWRIFNNLADYKSNTKSFNILLGYDTNWVRFRHLNMSDLNPNQFETFHSGHIVRLDLSKLGIRSIASGAFTNLDCLQILELQENNLTILNHNALIGLQRLKVLNLTKNHLTHVDNKTFGFIKTLHTLDLSWNAIHSIEENTFERLFNLKFLNLSHNLLVAVNFENWALSPRITKINLSNNSVTFLSTNTTSKVKHYMHLTSLNLSFNSLDYIDVSGLKTMAPNMTHLEIMGNMLQCSVLEQIEEDLKQLNLSNYVMEMSKNLKKRNEIDCLMDINQEQFKYSTTNANLMYLPREEIIQSNTKQLEAIIDNRRIIFLLFGFLFIIIVFIFLINIGLTKRIYKHGFNIHTKVIDTI